jgi:hypothetical protein
MLKIYLAARYSRNEEMRKYAERLNQLGHTVTSRWINGSHEISDAKEAHDSNARFAFEDMNDLIDSEYCVSFTDQPRSSYGRGGRHVELGIALGIGKRCAIIGPRENVFHYLPTIEWFSDFDSFVAKLMGWFT